MVASSLFSNGYLPAQHQGSILKADQPLKRSEYSTARSAACSARRLAFAESFDRNFLADASEDNTDRAAIMNYETAFRMQASVPELCDISGETEATHRKYGLDADDAEKAAYAQRCLLARRLVERGVRFIELSCLTENIRSRRYR